MMKILFVEDDKVSRLSLSDTLRKSGYQVIECERVSEAMEWLEEADFEVVLTDLRLGQSSGLEVLKAAKAKNKDTAVIVVTGYATVETAVEALKMGAYDYLSKPFSPEKVLSILQHIQRLNEVLHENQQLKKRITRYESREIIGNSAVMQKLKATLRSVAPTDHTVLLQGESGTGKELAAHYLHQFSERHKGPFVAVNCAVLPESLLESELFGHEKGAFTGAVRRHLGYFERAHGGTLFIDDIDDLPLHLQVKLLRVLQEREIQPIGGHTPIAVDLRLISATKVNLYHLVQQGKFREDLYYRLNIIKITMPPLRDHLEDLPLLIDHFIRKYHHQGPPPSLQPHHLERMMRYHWPGNVRELENAIQRMLALPKDVDFLHFDYQAQKATMQLSPPELTEELPRYDEYIGRHEQILLRRAMEKTNHNITRAARLLGLPRTTLQSKLEKIKSAATSHQADWEVTPTAK